MDQVSLGYFCLFDLLLLPSLPPPLGQTRELCLCPWPCPFGTASTWQGPWRLFPRDLRGRNTLMEGLGVAVQQADHLMGMLGIPAL